jgi:hypothetical protein
VLPSAQIEYLSRACHTLPAIRGSPNTQTPTIIHRLDQNRVTEGFFVSRTILTAVSAAALVCAAAYSLAGAPALAADNPFPNLAGTWNGSGTASLEGGKTENLRCKGYYTASDGGQSLGLSIRCANASSKVELRANLNIANGNVSGDWEERTYNQSGTVSGKASANRLNLAITGGIEGSLQVSLAGSSHSVSVLTGGSTLKGINISMSR